MRIDKFSLVSMEMIDYQLKDPVLDKILDIIRKNKNKEIDYDTFASLLENIIKERFGFTTKVTIEEKEIANGGARTELVDFRHPLLQQFSKYFTEPLFVHGTTKYTLPNILKIVNKKMDNVGKLDFKRAKVTGIFSQIPTHLYLTTGALDSNDEDVLLGTILHEIGHIWTFAEYVHHITFKNAIIANATKEFLSLKDEVSKTEFIIEAKNIFNVDIPKDLAKENDVNSNVVVLGSLVKAMYNDYTSGIYELTNVEVLADQFASRFGLHFERIKYLSQYNWNEMATESIIEFIKLSISASINMTLAVMGSALGLLSTPLFFIPLMIVWFYPITKYLKMEQLASYKNGGSTYDTFKQRSVRIRNMMINQLKTNPNNNDIKELIKHIEESEKYIEQSDDYNGFGVKFIRWISSDFRSQEERKIYQQLLEDLIDNKLYVTGNKFKYLLDK